MDLAKETDEVRKYILDTDELFKSLQRAFNWLNRVSLLLKAGQLSPVEIRVFLGMVFELEIQIGGINVLHETASSQIRGSAKDPQFFQLIDFNITTLTNEFSKLKSESADMYINQIIKHQTKVFDGWIEDPKSKEGTHVG